MKNHMCRRTRRDLPHYQKTQRLSIRATDSSSSDQIIPAPKISPTDSVSAIKSGIPICDLPIVDLPQNVNSG